MAIASVEYGCQNTRRQNEVNYSKFLVVSVSVDVTQHYATLAYGITDATLLACDVVEILAEFLHHTSIIKHSTRNKV